MGRAYEKKTFANKVKLRWRMRDSDRVMLLLVGDFSVSLLSVLLAFRFWFADGSSLQLTWPLDPTKPPLWYYGIPLLWAFLMLELYDLPRAGNFRLTLKAIIVSSVLLSISYLLAFFILGGSSLPRRGVAIYLTSVSILTLLWRLLYIKVFTESPFLRRALIIGAGLSGQTLVQAIQSQENLSFELIGLIDDDPDKKSTQLGTFPVLGNGSDLIRQIKTHDITDLFLAITHKINPNLLSAIIIAQESGVLVTPMPEVYEKLFKRVPIQVLEGDWILKSFKKSEEKLSLYLFSKRFLDLLGSIVGLFLLGVLFPLISFIIVVESGFPIIYSQPRNGKYGKTINVHKFRTMRKPSPNQLNCTSLEKDALRTTKVGEFLRKTHLDELPQFICVLRNEMSLVGPRAEWVELVPKFEDSVPFYNARLLVKPGITGWAQIEYGYARTVQETSIKLEYDLYYIQNRSFIFDLYILIKTLGNVFGFKGH